MEMVEDFRSRMLALRERFRREMNGEVSATMCVRGERYGLNYGVSLPTLRAIARQQGRDHAFARSLYESSVRELRLAALHIAEADRIREEEHAFWMQGIVNSEVAEEAAFALLWQLPDFALFYSRALERGGLPAYAALMAGARSGADLEALSDPLLRLGVPDRLAAQGIVALLTGIADRSPQERDAVRRTVDRLAGDAAEYVREECAWRLTD